MKSVFITASLGLVALLAGIVMALIPYGICGSFLVPADFSSLTGDDIVNHGECLAGMGTRGIWAWVVVAAGGVLLAVALILAFIAERRAPGAARRFVVTVPKTSKKLRVGSISDLERLAAMRASGSITDAEFDALKLRLLQ